MVKINMYCKEGNLEENDFCDGHNAKVESDGELFYFRFKDCDGKETHIALDSWELMQKCFALKKLDLSKYNEEGLAIEIEPKKFH